MIFEMIFILVDISWEIFGSSTREDPRPRQPTPVQRLPPLQGCDVCLTLSTKMKIISKLSFPVKILSEIASRMFLSDLESAETRNSDFLRWNFFFSLLREMSCPALCPHPCYEVYRHIRRSQEHVRIIL